jgi:ornithine cyclodeaminase/alanine dehydrogenase-like protein (mu-crystallin family)
MTSRRRDCFLQWRTSSEPTSSVAEGAASWDGIVSLGDVLLERLVPRRGRESVFVSLGLGVEDIAAAAAALDTLNK